MSVARFRAALFIQAEGRAVRMRRSGPATEQGRQPRVENREEPKMVSNKMIKKPPTQKKPVPPDQTHAENFYYLKQMQAKTPMVLVLKGGETIRGTIEWYDKNCLKISREEGPNLLVYKANIAYMYKQEG